MSGEDEVELKLQIEPKDIAILLADPIFAKHDTVARDHVSTYFDTKRHDLQAAGLSCRIRQANDKRVQTIKTESKAAASLFARGEWERAVDDDAPMLDDAPKALTKALSVKDRSLAPVFKVEIHRTTVVHGHGSDRIELVADQGRALVGARETRITEVELELLGGNREALFTLARQISDLVPVRLGVQSKSERGYALLEGEPSVSVKAEPISLSPEGDTASLFEAVAGSCIRQFRLNEDRLLATGSPASLHQARVGLRRLRSALSTFKAMLAGPEFDYFQAHFRRVASALGAVRDVDVMIEKLDHDPTLEILHAAREERYELALQMLNSQAVRDVMLDFVEWLSVGDWHRQGETQTYRVTPAVKTAAQTLDRLRHTIKRRGQHLAKLDEHERHKVRIVGKKLRYSAEFFADLYPGKKATHRHKAFIKTISDLQTALGHLNDLASGRALFAELGIIDPETILTTGKTDDKKRLIADAKQAYDDLIEMKRFWR